MLKNFFICERHYNAGKGLLNSKGGTNIVHKLKYLFWSECWQAKLQIQGQAAPVAKALNCLHSGPKVAQHLLPIRFKVHT